MPFESLTYSKAPLRRITFSKSNSQETCHMCRSDAAQRTEDSPEKSMRCEIESLNSIYRSVSVPQVSVDKFDNSK